MSKRKQQIIKRYRKVAWGRLYWRKHNIGRCRNWFDSDDVCIVRNGSLITHYKSLEDLLRDIRDEEEWERNFI